MNVYAILLESGIVASGQDLRETEVFKRSLALGLISNGDGQAKSAGSIHLIPPDAPTEEVLLQVSGMWCSSCAWLIEHALVNERGVVSAEANFASDLVKVKYCPQYLPPDRLSERIRELGYQAGEFSGEDDLAHREKRDLLLRLGVAGFLWLNIMTLSTALYVGYFEQIAESVRRIFPFILMALATPVLCYSAMPILRLAWRGLVNYSVRMETLLGIGILAAYLYSAIEALTGGQHVYFDTASAIVTLVLVGKLIERNAKARTLRAITLLYRMMPKKARIMTGDGERFVSIESLSRGDTFIVKAGERIPADGLVVKGSSHTDESLLTGESAPAPKRHGDGVAAGSVNLGGVLEIEATKVGSDTTLSQIIRLVENALSSKTSLERTVDRISRVFVPGVVVIAALTFGICWAGGFATAGDSLMRAITVLVIACPCALGMATPLAITAAIGAASRSGILISDGRVLEKIRRVDLVIFDKTGTITDGRFSLIGYDLTAADPATVAIAIGRPEIDPSTTSHAGAFDRFNHECLPLIASLERYSEHPLGEAILNRASDRATALREATEVEIYKGQGIAGIVAGRRVFIGNRRLVESAGAVITQSDDRRARDWENQGRTVAFFGWDGELRGMLAFGDRVKPDAGQVVSELKLRGLKTMIVSGDAKDTTAWAAAATGVDDFIAQALPEDKIRIISEFQRDGQVVAMIGDGINDAPALAQADLGIAVGSGADIAMKAAAVVLMKVSLNQIIEVFDFSQKTWRIIRQNLFWAFLYNSLAISLAVAGRLNPIMAAGAMLLSSLSVIGNSMRLTKVYSSSSANHGIN